MTVADRLFLFPPLWARSDDGRSFWGRGGDDGGRKGRSGRRERSPAEESAAKSSPDAEVIANIRQGTTDAFEAVYRANVASLAGFAGAILGDSDRARDVVADVFLDLWRNRAGFTAPAGVRAYLYTAVRNRALNELRSRGRMARWVSFFTGDTVGMGEGPSRADDTLEADERVEALRRALDALPEPRRTISRLRFQEGMGFDEIAAALGISANAVQQHLSRARRMIRDGMLDAFE